MTKDLIQKVNEDLLVKTYDFVKTKYKGLDVYFKVGGIHFYKSYSKKRKIVIHYTAGQINGDVSTLLKTKISVNFIVSPKGTIFMLFNPDYWSYHLGATALGGNTEMSKESIGIEISNYGWLTLQGDTLYTYPTKIGETLGNPYCTLADDNLYSITKDYRGKKYWCNFTEEQYTSVKNLIQVLTLTYDIPLKFLPDELKLAYTTQVIKHEGICSHVNFRKDKWDIGPNFNWDKLNGILTKDNIKSINKLFF